MATKDSQDKTYPARYPSSTCPSFVARSIAPEAVEGISAMQLRLFRSQSDQKGIFGGHKGVNFSLQYKLDISDEERGLIDHYKVGSFVLHTFQWGRMSDGTPRTTSISVTDLINGGSLALGDFDEVVGSEQGIRQGANNFKALLAQMRKFGGEEVIEI